MNAHSKYTPVLIAEANDEQWLLIQQAIRQQLPKVKPVRVTSLPQAMEHFKSWQQQEWDMPQLVLLNPYLPQLTDGWQLLSWMKAMPGSVRRVPVVLVSDSKTPADIDKAYQLGASSCLIRPTGLRGWLTCLGSLRAYWWETVTLPPIYYSPEVA